MRLTFVVGTGRRGSTMLSATLREHPDVLSMSEFFGTLRPVPRRPVPGRRAGRPGAGEAARQPVPDARCDDLQRAADRRNGLPARPRPLYPGHRRPADLPLRAAHAYL